MATAYIQRPALVAFLRSQHDLT